VKAFHRKRDVDNSVVCWP